VLFVSNKDLEKIFRANESVFELLFKHEDLEGIEEKPGGDIEFRYVDLDTKKSVEREVQAILNK
jgi:adenine-specific DNA methylase